MTLARWQNRRSAAHIPFNNLAAIHGQNSPCESTGIQPQVRSSPVSQGPTGSPDCAPGVRPTHFGPSHGPKVVLSSQRPGRRHTYPCPCGRPANLSPTADHEAAP